MIFFKLLLYYFPYKLKKFNIFIKTSLLDNLFTDIKFF